ncbi:hypothetical protein N8083_01220 [Candidatus Pacebacteria bacterium]|nr:hypothetical protein [Candidatus Paceibacterota bacterium]
MRNHLEFVGGTDVPDVPDVPEVALGDQLRVGEITREMVNAIILEFCEHLPVGKYNRLVEKLSRPSCGSLNLFEEGFFEEQDWQLFPLFFCEKFGTMASLGFPVASGDVLKTPINIFEWAQTFHSSTA